MKTVQDIEPGWHHAIQARRPVVVDATTDPEVPPLPPRITIEAKRDSAQESVARDGQRCSCSRLVVRGMVGYAGIGLWLSVRVLAS